MLKVAQEGGVTTASSGFCSGYRRRFLSAGPYYSCTPVFLEKILGNSTNYDVERAGAGAGVQRRGFQHGSSPPTSVFFPSARSVTNITLLWRRHNINRTRTHTAHASNGAVGDATLTLLSSSASCGGKHLVAIYVHGLYRIALTVSHRAHRGTAMGTPRITPCMKPCSISVCAAHPGSLRRARDSRRRLYAEPPVCLNPTVRA